MIRRLPGSFDKIGGRASAKRALPSGTCLEPRATKNCAEGQPWNTRGPRAASVEKLRRRRNPAFEAASSHSSTRSSRNTRDRVGAHDLHPTSSSLTLGDRSRPSSLAGVFIVSLQPPVATPGVLSPWPGVVCELYFDDANGVDRCPPVQPPLLYCELYLPDPFSGDRGFRLRDVLSDRGRGSQEYIIM